MLRDTKPCSFTTVKLITINSFNLKEQSIIDYTVIRFIKSKPYLKKMEEEFFEGKKYVKNKDDALFLPERFDNDKTKDIREGSLRSLLQKIRPSLIGLLALTTIAATSIASPNQPNSLPTPPVAVQTEVKTTPDNNLLSIGTIETFGMNGYQGIVPGITVGYDRLIAHPSTQGDLVLGVTAECSLARYNSLMQTVTSLGINAQQREKAQYIFGLGANVGMIAKDRSLATILTIGYQLIPSWKSDLFPLGSTSAESMHYADIGKRATVDFKVLMHVGDKLYLLPSIGLSGDRDDIKPRISLSVGYGL